MTLTLAIDTSTDVRVGFARDGNELNFGVVADPRAHCEQLMPLVVRLAQDAGVGLSQLDQIVVGVGPGPFTGLRVGVVTALTLGETLGIPVRGVCSLDAVARQWALQDAPKEFVVVSDARRREVYWARYVSSGTRVDGPHVSAPNNVPPLPLSGPGASLVGEPQGPVELDAAFLAAVESELPDMSHEPLYLRRPDAEVPTRTKSTLASTRRGLRRRSR